MGDHPTDRGPRRPEHRGSIRTSAPGIDRPPPRPRRRGTSTGTRTTTRRTSGRPTNTRIPSASSATRTSSRRSTTWIRASRSSPRCCSSFGVVAGPPLRPLEFALLLALLLAVTVISRVPVRWLLTRSAIVLPIALGIAVFAPLGQATSFSCGRHRRGVLRELVDDLGDRLQVVDVRVHDAAALGDDTDAAALRRAAGAQDADHLHHAAHVPVPLHRRVRRRSCAPCGTPSRAGHPSSRGWGLVRLYGNLAGNLFIRAYERGERIHAAMLSRGYDGVLPADRHPDRDAERTGCSSSRRCSLSPPCCSTDEREHMNAHRPIRLARTRLLLSRRDARAQRHRSRDRAGRARRAARPQRRRQVDAHPAPQRVIMPTEGPVAIDGNHAGRGDRASRSASASASSSRTPTTSSS